MANNNWKSIVDLREPFNDAVNYRSKSEKEFFNRIFLKTDDLKRCLAHSVYFLIGEKGVGKTAYAVYLENNSIDGTRCKLVTMTETQYKRFIELKKQGKLSYSDYANIWRSMLLFMASQVLVKKSKSVFHSITGKFKKIEAEVNKWNKTALNPEVESAFEAIRGDSITAKLKHDQIGEVGAEQKAQDTEKTSFIKHHLLETESALKEAIDDLKLSHDHILFIDGIDFRPESVPYQDYLECIKGLGEAVWQLNADFFQGIKDSKGRIKIVLLVRPDIFHSLNLYNSNSRMQDNCVFLDWSTTERDLETSRLYEASGLYFASQQPSKVGNAEAWQNYFPANSSSRRDRPLQKLLKTSFQKPRDVFTSIKILRNLSIKRGQGDKSCFDVSLIRDPAFTKDYSDYLLGEVRNFAAFYMTQDDFSHYLKFFQYLNGKSEFQMNDFEEAHAQFFAWAKAEDIKATVYLRDPQALLQFFYDVNIVGYKETANADSEIFHHWSFRERSLNNIAPKVKVTSTLVLNPGVAKALDIGKSMTNTLRPLTPRQSGKKPSKLAAALSEAKKQGRNQPASQARKRPRPLQSAKNQGK